MTITIENIITTLQHDGGSTGSPLLAGHGSPSPPASAPARPAPPSPTPCPTCSPRWQPPASLLKCRSESAAMIAHLLGLCPLPARPRSAPVRSVRLMDREPAPTATLPVINDVREPRTRADRLAAQLNAAHSMLCAAPYPLRRQEVADALDISAEHAGYLLYKLGKAGRANCIGLGAASAWVPATERAA